MNNGGCYEGTYKDGKKTGKGRTISNMGVFYIGYNHDSKMEGIGICAW